MPGVGAAATMQAVQGVGELLVEGLAFDSESWKGAKSTARASWNRYLEANPGDVLPLAEMTAAHYTNPQTYEKYAYWMSQQVIPPGKKNQGKPYMASTMVDYLQVIMNDGANRFRAFDEPAREFYTCLDAKSQSQPAAWYRKLKHRITYQWFQKSIQSGAVLDDSAAPIYRSHVEAISIAYSKHGDAESMMRRFAVLCLHYSMGRSSEITWTTFDHLKWDQLFQCAVAEQMNLKNCKVKQIMFPSSSTRNLCWNLALGDFMSMSERPPIGADEQVRLFINDIYMNLHLQFDSLFAELPI